MAKLSFAKNATGKSIDLFIRNSSVTGSVSGLVGLTSGSVTCYYHRPGAVATQLTLTSLASITSTHLSGGFIEVNSATYRGFYRLDVSNTMLATGVDFVTISMSGAANMDQVTAEIELLDAVNVSGGVVESNIIQVSGTVIPAPATAGYLPVTVKSGTGTGELSLSSGQVVIQNGTGTGQLSFVSGIVASNIRQVSGTAIAAPATAGYLSVTVKPGTGTGEINLNSGRADANIVYVGGAALSTTAAQLGVNVVAWSATNVTAMSSGRLVASVGEYQSGLTPLQPTVAGRTLGVNTTGQVGLDWSNISGAGTVVNLSQTSISSVSTGASGPTSGQIAAQVWATVVSGNTTAGTFGERASRVPNAAAGSVGGLPLADASGAVLLATGTGANQILLSSGEVTATGGGGAPTSGEVATQVWATIIEGSFTAIASMKLQNAVIAGLVSGQQNLAPVFRDLSDTVNRVTATTTVSGNRTAITYDMA